MESTDRADTALSCGVAVVRILCSPVRGPKGELRTHDILMPQACTIADALPPALDVDRVIRDGVVIPSHLYDEEWLHPGQDLLVIPRLGLAEGSLAALLAYAAVSIAVGLAVSAITYYIFRPTPPKIRGPEQPILSFGGIRTTRGPGAPIPVVYGRHRVGGQLIAFSVEHQQTYIDNGQETTTLPISNVTGGEASSSEYQPPNPITVTSTGHGLQTGTQITISGVQGKFGTNNVWIVNPVINANQFQLASSDGVDGNTYTGGGIITVPAGNVSRNVSESPARFKMLIGLCEGEIDAVETNTILINNQPIGNFPDVFVETRVGTATQTPISWASETANTVVDGREITTGGGITYTTTIPVNAFVLNLSFNEGLVHFNRNGEKENNYVDIRYRFRVPAGAWSDYRQIRINGARAAPVHFGIRRNGLALSVYEINVEIAVDDDGHAARVVDPDRSKYRPFLTSVTQVVDGAKAYPYTALCGLQGIATENLQGDVPDFSVVVRGLKIRVGGLSVARTWSDNNAWCLLDYFTHPRYGMAVADSEMDLLAFQVAANYCDELIAGEKRHTLNWVHNTDRNAPDVLEELKQTFRCVLFKSAGLWTPRISRDDIPVQPLSWANCTNVQIQYLTDPERVNVLEAQYVNEDSNKYDTDVLTWPRPENQSANPRKATVQLPGITKGTRVDRDLQYRLNQIRLPRVMLTCDAASDAIVFQPHDIVRFSHPMPGWGVSGRVVAASTTVLGVDEDVTFQPGLTYHVYVRNDVNQYVVRSLINPATGGAVVTRTLSIPAGTPLPWVSAARTSHWSVGQSTPVDTSSRLFRIVSMRSNDDLTVHIEAIQHNPSIYDDPVASPLPPVSDLPNPLGPPPPLLSLTATELVRIGPDGRSRTVVNLAWDNMAYVPGYGYGVYGGAIIYRRELSATSTAGHAIAGQAIAGALVNPTDVVQDFVRIGSALNGLLEWDDALVIQGATYEWRVIPLSQRGVPNTQGARQAMLHIAGPTTPSYYPPTPSNIRLVVGNPPAIVQSGIVETGILGDDRVAFIGRDAGVAWDPVMVNELYRDRIFIEGYRIEMHGPSSMYILRDSQHITGTQYVYPYASNVEDSLTKGFTSAQREFTFKVWSRTTSGTESLLPATLTAYNEPPDMSNLLPTIYPIVEGLLVDWTSFIEPIDLAKYDVLYGPVGGALQLYTGVAQFQQTALLTDLDTSVTYNIQIVPYDTFGPGVASGIAQGDPLKPAERWRFFVRDFNPDGLEFTPDPVGNSVTWSAGILHYVDDNGDTNSQPISGASAFWTPATTLFVYYILGESFFRVSLGIVEALGANRAIMAVYNGGTNLVVLYGKARVHGSDIIANSIGANQIAVGNAVITQSAQIANAIVTNAHIQNLAADKITAGTISAAMVMAGLFQTPLVTGLSRSEFDSSGFRIYDPLGNVIINLHSGGFFQLGYQAGARIVMDAISMEVFDATNVSVFRLQNFAPLVRIGRVDGTQLELNNAGSLRPLISQNITQSAISGHLEYVDPLGFLQLTGAEVEIAALTMDLSLGGRVRLTGKCQTDLNTAETTTMRIRVTSVVGQELDRSDAGGLFVQTTAELPLTCEAVYTATEGQGLTRFVLTAHSNANIVGSTTTAQRIKFIAMHFKR